MYQGLAHRICNIRYKILLYIPIAFHNLSGYNEHLFIRESWKKFDSRFITVIAENKETYNTDVSTGTYEDMWGRIKNKKMQLRLSTALGLWPIAWICSLGIWLR